MKGPLCTQRRSFQGAVPSDTNPDPALTVTQAHLDPEAAGPTSPSKWALKSGKIQLGVGVFCTDFSKLRLGRKALLKSKRAIYTEVRVKDMAVDSIHNWAEP